MILRFLDTGNLQRAVIDGWLADPDHAFVMKQHVYLLENGDLYIDDDFDPDLTGMFLMRLRNHNFFEEEAEIIGEDLDIDFWTLLEESRIIQAG